MFVLLVDGTVPNHLLGAASISVKVWVQQNGSSEEGACTIC